MLCSSTRQSIYAIFLMWTSQSEQFKIFIAHCPNDTDQRSIQILYLKNHFGFVWFFLQFFIFCSFILFYLPGCAGFRVSLVLTFVALEQRSWAGFSQKVLAFKVGWMPGCSTFCAAQDAAELTSFSMPPPASGPKWRVSHQRVRSKARDGQRSILELLLILS